MSDTDETRATGVGRRWGRPGSYDMSRHQSTVRPVAMLAAAILLIGLSACGDDSDGAAETADTAAADTTTPETTTPDTATPETTTPETTTPETTTPETTTPQATAPDTTAPETTAPDTTEAATADPVNAGDEPAVCGAYFAVNDAMSALFAGFGDPSDIPPLVAEVDAVKPAEIDAELTTMIDAVAAWEASGFADSSALDAPEMGEASATVDSWMFENCTFDTKVEVALVDYAFEGLEPSYPVGMTAFRVTNDGTESHEMALVRRADGVTETWDELLALPEEEIAGKVEFLGAAFAPAPGMTSVLVSELTPGDYLALCFVPLGSTPGTEGDGPPHMTAGMRAEFTVA
jgi:hypothetical protein